MSGTDISDRSRGLALCLAIPLGVFGLHRFYAGKIGTGLIMLATGGGLGIWWLYDIRMVAGAEFRDIDGKRVVRWSVYDPGDLAVSPASANQDALLEELQLLQEEVRELGERTDFMERLLTQVREEQRAPLPAPRAEQRG